MRQKAALRWSSYMSTETEKAIRSAAMPGHLFARQRFTNHYMPQSRRPACKCVHLSLEGGHGHESFS
ncbi:hypothetical protein M404DRAFT_1008540 [Pisolithus tinctorius Marx 270]|uniref:Uncharacterized protein n=1 Tax=Pisolithus tinctorius Marx 270 TaxID=870435 RepID=A0A0C3NEK2_PISTI|nr:hypothetical protein M404DRAFT_1008540 [Pisolithus tinctorius Marx 270]